MQAFSRTSEPWQEVLDRLPPDLDLDALAISSGALKRRREVGDGATLLRLALARGPGGLSLNQTAAWAAIQGLARLSDPAVKYRLDQAVPFLKALLEQQLAERAGSRAICWPGRSLCLVDGTHISQPGSQGSDWLIHAGFDLGGGGFSHLELTDKHGAESAARGAPRPGEVRIGDRNFATAKVLADLRAQSDNQVDFLVRAGWKSFALSHRPGAAFDLIAHVQALPHDWQPHEVWVQAQVEQTTQLPLRLIILRQSAEQTKRIRKRLRRRAQRKQHKLDPRSLVAAEFLILATSLPADAYPAAGVLAVYRLRWQIELAFKRLKSLLHIDRLPTRRPAASQSWLYAHLILALLCDDLSQDFLAFSP
jgi:Transposase DDE domain